MPRAAAGSRAAAPRRRQVRHGALRAAVGCPRWSHSSRCWHSRPPRLPSPGPPTRTLEGPTAARAGVRQAAVRRAAARR
eukprot:scaffold47586_cov51-Phaeocystis_antarctica.AAC.1